jgi:PP-loop superfamily ATP-utilizing enzyme
MKQTEAREAEIEKKRIIEYAASLGINLTVLDRPSQQIQSEKVKESNRMLAQMDLSFLKNR